MLSRKLEHYYVTGVLIEPGRYVDRHGHKVVFRPNDEFEVADVVPIYYEHDGPIVGFAHVFIQLITNFVSMDMSLIQLL